MIHLSPLKQSLTALLTFAFSSLAMAQKISNTVTQDPFSPDKYLGTWYEIARIPHFFERDMVGVQAKYSMLPNGKISVLNSGYKYTLDGKYSQAKGKGYIPDLKDPSKLKVSFFWCFYADYWVIEVSDNYTYSLVGSSTGDYLWILSRTPRMPKSIYLKMVELARERFYQVDKLEVVEQVKGKPTLY